ncbi:hypothetical protein PLICRDRAFT_125890 [Plicaturopsis crispa FD-325 SS-3]|nr:hypothetical protein PLICRDRAFT_125890 [Plicaturopsis crispa FD-325 SS-3]
MDFFSSVQTDVDSSSTPQGVDSFAEAIATRFGSGSMLTARLVVPELPPPTSQRPPSTPMANMSLQPTPKVVLQKPPPTQPSSSFAFAAVTPSELPSLLEDQGVLILDIRPHAAYSTARLPRSLSLSVPSTLLKRPLFGLDRLAAMLPSASARNRFSSWRTASRIVVYDADASAVPDSSNINGLLRKFKNDGFEPSQLAWLKGGFQAVWRERRDLVVQDPPHPDTDDDAEDGGSTADTTALRTRHLPMSAFSLTSTTRNNKPAAQPKRAFNPFFDTIRQNTELSHGITERIPLRLPARVRRRIADLPFRWLQDIARRAAPRVQRPARPFDDGSSESDGDDPEVDPADVDEGAEALAMQFYRIELAEQRRLQGVMEHHSKESLGEKPDIGDKRGAFPFSITAGVEKGAKNRYRHIWPFEHARVRLHRARCGNSSDEDDYVNASYVQPLGTNKRYIATQGPLPATFTDFWILCWEQNVHVVVMLTREIEGAMVKCGTYWTEGSYGPLRLKLIHSTENTAPERTERGFFGPARQSGPPPATTVKRTFELTHTGYPQEGARVVTHLQYLDWLDMDVPEDPRGVLGLMKEVDALQRAHGGRDSGSPTRSRSTSLDERTGIVQHARGEHSPVLLHCSAGVGRTGGFIAVDAVLDAIKREMLLSTPSPEVETEPVRRGLGKVVEGRVTDMDVDGASTSIERGPTMPLTVSAGDRSGPHVHRSAADDTLVVHVPVGGWNLRDAAAANMSMDVDEESARPSTRMWAETVQDETKARSIPSPKSMPSLKSVASPGHSSTSSILSTASLVRPSSGSSSDARSEPDSLDIAHRGSTDSSGATSVSTGSTKPVPETHADSWPSLEADTRLRTFSVPSKRPALHEERTAKPGIGSSPLASTSTPWLGAGAPMASPSHFAANSPAPMASSSHPRPMQVSLDRGESSSRESSGPPQSETVPSSSSREDSLGAEDSSRPGAPHTNTSPPATMDDVLGGNRITNVDYKEPRPLHDDASPVLLSTFDEPIWQVVQDMREQRMSLCQSLRQYVFVHAAVIEGALQIVDELRKETGYRGVDVRMGDAKAGLPPVLMQHHSSGSTTSSGSPSRTKRGASPTELRRTDKSGEVSLSKRPSLKRKRAPAVNLQQVEAAPDRGMRTDCDMTFKSFAVFGAGHIGGPIIQALAKLEGISVLVVLRTGGAARTLPSGVKTATVDYADKAALVALFKEHAVEVVISAVGFPALEWQKDLAAAAKEAGVSLFAPSEFGLPSEGWTENSALKTKSDVIEYARSIGLPYVLYYTGMFSEYLPFLSAIEESGKYYIVGKGDTPLTFTAIADISGFVAYTLTQLPLSQLANATLRIEGTHTTLRDAAALYGGKYPVVHVDAVPGDVPAADIRTLLQQLITQGAASAAYDPRTGKDGAEKADSANGLWEGHVWEDLKTTLRL